MARSAASRSRPRARRAQRLTRLAFRSPSRGSASSRRKSARKRKGGPGRTGRLRFVDPRQWRVSIPSRRLVPALAAAVLVALGMAALRIDLIRSRYEIGMNYSEENRLSREIAQRTARMRKLRDPGRLGKRAKALGFARPKRVIELPSASDSLNPEPGTLRLAILPGAGSDRP